MLPSPELIVPHLELEYKRVSFVPAVSELWQVEALRGVRRRPASGMLGCRARRQLLLIRLH
jgi:hypothetical protein